MESVQLVPGPQVPLPPLMLPSGLVVPPFQNWICPGVVCTTRLSWLASAVCRLRLPSATGKVPKVRPLSVKLPP